jgi:nucleoside-diphosphate-sugar epimerase
VSYYDETKHKAHKVAQDFIARGLPLVIVQPGGVYGPGDTSPQGRLIHQFLDGKLPAMMFPETGFNMVHRDDVADGILLCLDKGKAGEAYVLGGQITTMGEAIKVLGRVAGRKPPRLTLPSIMIKAAAPLGPLIGPAMGQGPNLGEIIKATDTSPTGPRTTRLATSWGIRPGAWSRVSTTPWRWREGCPGARADIRVHDARCHRSRHRSTAFG